MVIEREDEVRIAVGDTGLTMVVSWHHHTLTSMVVDENDRPILENEGMNL